MAGVDTIGMACRVLDFHNLDYELKRGKHVKIVVTHGTQRQILVTGGTVSDNRAIKNFYHQIKRTLLSLGVAFQECKSLIHN